jgi:hypothetical protein
MNFENETNELLLNLKKIGNNKNNNKIIKKESVKINDEKGLILIFYFN